MPLFLGGCGGLLPRSQYTRPAVDVLAQWQEPAVTGTEVASGEQWWRRFNDPVLDGLIDRALRTNNDLAAAALKVRRARLQAQLTGTNLTPSVSVTAGSSVSTDIREGRSIQSHSVTGSLSYELDLWGKLASARDADRWEAEATEVDRQSTALSLIGTVASSYWQIAYLNQRIASSEASIAYAEKTRDLVAAKYRAGAVAGLDLAQSEQAVATQKATLAQLQQQRTEARNALAILFDQAPKNAVPERERLPDGPLPSVDAGLPASLLGRRPDVRAAELRLREYLANVDVSRASFYPAFTLTGSLGGTSTSLVNVLQNPVAVLGAGLTLTFLQWTTTKLNLKVSETIYEEGVVSFRKTLYTALGEVENALSANIQYQAQGKELERALSFAEKGEQLAGIRYRQGSTGVQSWLDEQERRRNAENSLAENRLNRLTSLMKLYQALGGEGWTADSARK